MMQHELDQATLCQIQDLCAQGDAHAAQSEFEIAFGFYSKALRLIPEPAEDWEATTWILAAIGDLYFLDGKFEKAHGAFTDAVRCPGGFGNPFIHLRLGQCHFEMGTLELAADELTRAYMGAGREALEKEDAKYLQFLDTALKPPIDRTNS